MMGGTESGIICPFKALLPLPGAEILVLLAMMDSSIFGTSLTCGGVGVRGWDALPWEVQGMQSPEAGAEP